MNAIESLRTKCEIVNSNFAINIEILSYTTNFVLMQIYSRLRHRKFRSFHKFMSYYQCEKRHCVCFVILKKYKLLIDFFVLVQAINAAEQQNKWMDRFQCLICCIMISILFT